MGDADDDGAASISDPTCVASLATNGISEIEKVGQTSMYELYKSTGSSAIPIADSMAMKNTAPGPHGAEPISLTAPNFYGSTIAYNSPSIFAPFVVGGHTNIVNKVGCSFYCFARNVLGLSVRGTCFGLQRGSCGHDSSMCGFDFAYFCLMVIVMTENVRCSFP